MHGVGGAIHEVVREAQKYFHPNGIWELHGGLIQDYQRGVESLMPQEFESQGQAVALFRRLQRYCRLVAVYSFEGLSQLFLNVPDQAFERGAILNVFCPLGAFERGSQLTTAKMCQSPRSYRRSARSGARALAAAEIRGGFREQAGAAKNCRKAQPDINGPIRRQRFTPYAFESLRGISMTFHLLLEAGDACGDPQVLILGEHEQRRRPCPPQPRQSGPGPKRWRLSNAGRRSFEPDWLAAARLSAPTQPRHSGVRG